jgi:hypothetical protein
MFNIHSRSLSTACNTYLLLDYSYVEGRHVDSNTKQSNNGVEGHMIDDAVINEDANIHVSRYMRIGVVMLLGRTVSPRHKLNNGQEGFSTHSRIT